GGAVAPDADTPDAADVGREVPALRRVVEAAGGAVGGAGARGRVESDGRQRSLLAGRGVVEFHAAARAVIIGAEIGAVRGADTVDHAGLHVGDIELPVPAVVGDVAERGAAIRAAVERHLREGLRAIVRCRPELVDRAGAA